MPTPAQTSRPPDVSSTIFAAIRELVDERLRKHQETKPSTDDADLMDELVDFCHRFGALDQASALTSLIRFARLRELRDIANQIAILAFENYGQELHILNERLEEAAS
jgi:hypothetical protein